jgi:hypothetical protein
MLNVKLSLIEVLAPAVPVTTEPNNADAGGVNVLGVGPVMTLAALAIVALPTSAIAPVAARSIFRIADLPVSAQVDG